MSDKTNDNNGGDNGGDGNKENESPQSRGSYNGKNGKYNGGNVSYNINQPYNWKGRNESFGMILALKSEKYEYKTLYSVFIERLKNHAIQEYTHGNDIVSLIENYKDPKDDINDLLPKNPVRLRKKSRKAGSTPQKSRSLSYAKVLTPQDISKVKQEEPVNSESSDDDEDDYSDDEYGEDVQALVVKELVKNHINRLTKLDMNKMKLYGLIWGQLTTGLQEVIKGDEEFTEKDLQFDCIWLLIKCKLTTAGLDERANKYSNYVKAVRQAFTVKQRENETNDAYRKRFDSQVLTLDLVGGNHVMSSPDIMRNIKTNTLSAADIIAEEQRTKAMMLILGADPTRFQSLQESLEEGVLLGRDEYPVSVTQAYELMQSTCPVIAKSSGRFSRFTKGGRFRGGGNLSFAQLGQNSKAVPGRDGRLFEHIKCHGCDTYGHYKNQCPKARDVVLAQFVLSQHELTSINPNWILLDTCSTVSVYCNEHLVHNLKPCQPHQELDIITNGGSETFTSMATANIVPITVHFNPRSLANILSLGDVANIPGARLTMDTEVERAILLHVNGDIIKFHECKDGLYFYDTGAHKHSNATVSPYTSSHSFVQRVDHNKALYSRKQIAGADTARRIQAAIGFPSTEAFKNIVSTNLIRNCGITADDITRADRIYGPPAPILQGKSTRSQPKRLQVQYTPLPLQIQERHANVNLHIDFFYVNGLPFLHTKSETINFLTVQSGKTRNTRSILEGLSTVIKLYNNRGFKVRGIFGDNEFDIANLRTELLPTILHVFAAGEHCPIAERSIRTIKERCRCVCHSVPYKRYTKLMVYGLIDSTIYWLNSFPSKGGASQTISPAGIVTGRNSPDFNNKYIPFGAYAWAYTKTTNTMEMRRVPGIALGPSNEWGGQYFMSLYTGKKIHSYDWVETPIDEDVISRVEELAQSEEQPVIAKNMPLFEWAIGNLIIDKTDDTPSNFLDISEMSENTDEVIEIPQEMTTTQPLEITSNNITLEEPVEIDSDVGEDNLGLDPDTLPSLEKPDTMIINNDVDGDSTTEEDSRVDRVDNDKDLEELYRNMEEMLDEEIRQINDISNEENGDSSSTEQSEYSEKATNDTDENNNNIDNNLRRSTRNNAGKPGPRLLMDMGGKDYKTINYNLLMKKKKMERAKKGVILTTLKKKSNYINKSKDLMNKAVGIILTQQMSAKKGIKKFGEKAVAAMIKEFSQLDQGAFPGKPVIDTIDADSLSREQKAKALEAVNLIAEKRCGRIKGRTCANGSTQRKYLRQDETVASPTVGLESILSTLLVDAHEGRAVGIFDIPGAYLHAEMPKEKLVIMKLRGEFVDIMCEVNPKYKPFVKIENGKKVLYLRVLRAIYGCIESALLWYDLFSSTLAKMGFTINPYDRCVANKIINGKQCTIVWYVDDVKVSHMEEAVVDDIVKVVEEHFGEMKVCKDKTFDYLGMNITITADKKIQIEMKAQIEDAIKSFGEDVQGTVTSPTAKHLFMVDEDCPKLGKEKADIFHSVTAKLLYLEKRARPDIETAVAFLTTRVMAPNHDDWKKLRRVLLYLKCTLDDVRVLGCDDLHHVFMWVDAAFAVHPNMRSQTGGAMSMGWGLIHGKSSKQKLNTKSSTEAELVGVSEYIPYNIWLLNFMGAQGYHIKHNVLYQDNESAIRMERNGRNSCTGNSRHVHIRYFFVKDRIDKGEVSVKYCPTYQMLADYFTKPLQGRMFGIYRDVLMGWKHISTLQSIPSPCMKERVENIAESNKAAKSEKNNLIHGDVSEDTWTKDNFKNNKNKLVSWKDNT